MFEKPLIFSAKLLPRINWLIISKNLRCFFSIIFLERHHLNVLYVSHEILLKSFALEAYLHIFTHTWRACRSTALLFQFFRNKHVHESPYSFFGTWLPFLLCWNWFFLVVIIVVSAVVVVVVIAVTLAPSLEPVVMVQEAYYPCIPMNQRTNMGRRGTKHDKYIKHLVFVVVVVLEIWADPCTPVPLYLALEESVVSRDLI